MAASDRDPKGPQFHSQHGDGERHSLREYTPLTGKKDVDQFEQALKTKAFMWSFVGALLGALLGLRLTMSSDAGGLVVAMTTLVGWGMAYAFPLVIAHLSGKAASTLHAPSGRSTPPKREYSQAESFAVRGQYADAIAAFELAIHEGDGLDPTPYLRVARTYRDHLGEFEDAARWFRKALRESKMEAGQTLLTNKELVELYRVKMGEPAKAAPMLARMAEEFADTREGRWAAEELASIKSQMADDGQEKDG